MTVLWALAGVLVLSITTVDVLTTVFGASMGGGPLSRALTALAAVTARRRLLRRWMVWVGPLLTAATVPVWLAGVWLGWGLIFQSASTPVVTTSGVPVGAGERFYFVGYAITTLGNGELQPNGLFWQLVTVVVSASGLLLVTLGLSYLISLVNAVVTRRALASEINGLGSRAVEICLAAWNGTDLHNLDGQLTSLNSQLAGIGQQQLAYPALHYFYSRHRPIALAPNVAVLDEAVTIMAHALPARCQPNPLALRQVRASIWQLLMVAQQHISAPPKGSAPPAPSLQPLRRAGLPVVPDEEFRRALDENEERRIALKMLVAEEGWDWPTGAEPFG